MESWNLAPIAKETQRLVESAPTPVERGQARLMLDRLNEFDALARKAGLNPTNAVVPAGSATGSGSAVTSAGYTTNGQYDASLYDATGWLVPVYAAGKDQPTHALTNKSGQIIAYVSGLPGMNLELYVNQSVGIQGLRGYLPQLKANHIQAQRVVRIAE